MPPWAHHVEPVSGAEITYARLSPSAAERPATPAAVGQLKTPWGLAATDAHGFNTMGFSPEGEMYFQYAVTSDSTSYTIAARSDISRAPEFLSWNGVPCGRIVHGDF